MRARAAVALVLAGMLLAGCGSESEPRTAQPPSSEPTPTASTSDTPRMGGGSLDHQDSASVLELADAVDIVVLGTVASWQDGFELVVDGDEDGETRIPYAVLSVTVDQLLKGHADEEVLVPVRLDEERATYEADMPVGSNVAFLGDDTLPPSTFEGTTQIEQVPDSIDVRSLKWGAFQGILVESESGEVRNLDTFSRAPLWPEIAEVPAEEQFGALAQQLMSLQG